MRKPLLELVNEPAGVPVSIGMTNQDLVYLDPYRETALMIDAHMDSGLIGEHIAREVWNGGEWEAWALGCTPEWADYSAAGFDEWSEVFQNFIDILYVKDQKPMLLFIHLESPAESGTPGPKYAWRKFMEPFIDDLLDCLTATETENPYCVIFQERVGSANTTPCVRQIGRSMFPNITAPATGPMVYYEPVHNSRGSNTCDRFDLVQLSVNPSIPRGAKAVPPPPRDFDPYNQPPPRW